MDEKYIKGTILHPFFKSFNFLQNDRANTRLRNKIISELVEELETSSAYKDRLTNPNSQSNSGTSIESFKILKQYFQDEVVVSDKEGETNQTISADKILRNYLWCTDGCLESLIDFR
jgi:hypothetical protein